MGYHLSRKQTLAPQVHNNENETLETKLPDGGETPDSTGSCQFKDIKIFWSRYDAFQVPKTFADTQQWTLKILNTFIKLLQVACAQYFDFIKSKMIMYGTSTVTLWSADNDLF